MSRDKQIEEMCAIMADASYEDCEDTPLVPESAGICDKVDCHRCKEARRLMSAGYRKASEVALETIAEAIELARHSADEAKVRADKEANVLLRAELRGQQIGANLMLYALAKLKKKYESEKGNEETIR